MHQFFNTYGTFSSKQNLLANSGGAYSTYGMLLPNRSQDGYRYGFQGQEADDEVKGEGNSWNYKYRMHDARIGRFFAIDPLAAKYPHYTPYQFSGNRVIDGVELEGLEVSILNENGEEVARGPISIEAIDNYTNSGFIAVNVEPVIQEFNRYYESSMLKTYSTEEYSKIWEQKYGMNMTNEMKETLDRGCIGVTCVNLNITGDPGLTRAFSSLEEAQKQKDQLTTDIALFPELFSPNSRPVIFSLRFYSHNKKEFKPNADGVVDMSNWDGRSRGGRFDYPFDYGFYDESDRRWWGADHSAPNMTVKSTNLEFYSRKLRDFNRQVFVVEITTLPLPK